MTDRTDTLKTFLAANPTDSFLQHALALEYIKAGNDALARALFEAVLQREPEYIGSYYHLAKLLERTGEKELAMKWYESGMENARKAGDGHAYNELRNAFEEIEE